MLAHNNNLLLSLKPPSFTLKFALERDLLSTKRKYSTQLINHFGSSLRTFSVVIRNCKDKQPITLKS